MAHRNDEYARRLDHAAPRQSRSRGARSTVSKSVVEMNASPTPTPTAALQHYIQCVIRERAFGIEGEPEANAALGSYIREKNII